MNWRKLLSSSGLMRSGNIISQHLSDPATMKLIDEAFISGAKTGVPGKIDKASKAYSKIVAPTELWLKGSCFQIIEAMCNGPQYGCPL